VRRFAGQFAFALFDRQTRTLSLARDRFGEKPLYYGWAERTLLFGSELKALRAHPAWQGGLDRDALAVFLRHSYIPAPSSIYRGIYKVSPGTVLSFRGGPEAGRSQETAYWSAREIAERGTANPIAAGDDDLTDQLDGLLRPVIRRQMLADVPLSRSHVHDRL
jgi:asparagine synthase (glutamine-hydrolysing)